MGHAAEDLQTRRRLKGRQLQRDQGNFFLARFDGADARVDFMLVHFL
jgi:hypothetical protein